MGIACALQIWMDYVTLLLNNLGQKSRYIMDDLLIHSSKQAHWELLRDLLKSMIKQGLKLSPMKCQLFQTTLTYMGNDFVIRDKSVTITPLKSHTEVIQKIPTICTVKDCKSFCGLVNYFSLFCNSCQKILKPIADLTRKAVPLIWGKVQELTLDAINKMISEPPVLYLPRSTGRLILYSDMSREHTDSCLW